MIAGTARPDGGQGTRQAATAGIREAARDLEGMFLGLLLKEMSGSAGHRGLLTGGLAGGIFHDLWLQEVARVSAVSGPLGLADLLVAQLSPARPPSDRGAAEADAGKPPHPGSRG